jgi:hypothetical protein
MVDAGDSKSPALTGVPVRVRPWVPTYTVSFREFSIKTSKTRVLAFLRGCFTRLFTGLFGIILGILTQHCFGWKSLRRFLTETSQTVFDSSETDIRFLAKQPLMIYNKNQPMGLSMSKTSQDKLPQYVYRTPFGVYRLRRNLPKDIVEVSGRKLWYKVLGNDFKDAMRTYSTALLEFDRFVATINNLTILQSLG